MLYTRVYCYCRFDWGEVVELRAHLSAKYNQGPYLPNTVQRRSDMTLAEFRDMWDGKWYVDKKHLQNIVRACVIRPFN